MVEECSCSLTSRQTTWRSDQYGFNKERKWVLLKDGTVSSWVDYNDIRRFNGSNWNDKATVRRWNGSSWQVISEQKRTDVWTCSWTKSYNQDNMPQSGAKEGFPGRLYQGRYGNPDSYWYGNCKVGKHDWFFSNVTDTLKGAKLKRWSYTYRYSGLGIGLVL